MLKVIAWDLRGKTYFRFQNGISRLRNYCPIELLAVVINKLSPKIYCFTGIHSNCASNRAFNTCSFYRLLLLVKVTTQLFKRCLRDVHVLIFPLKKPDSFHR